MRLCLCWNHHHLFWVLLEFAAVSPDSPYMTWKAGGGYKARTNKASGWNQTASQHVRRWSQTLQTVGPKSGWNLFSMLLWVSTTHNELYTTASQLIRNQPRGGPMAGCSPFLPSSYAATARNMEGLGVAHNSFPIYFAIETKITCFWANRTVLPPHRWSRWTHWEPAPGWPYGPVKLLPKLELKWCHKNKN